MTLKLIFAEKDEPESDVLFAFRYRYLPCNITATTL